MALLGDSVDTRDGRFESSPILKSDLDELQDQRKDYFMSLRPPSVFDERVYTSFNHITSMDANSTVRDRIVLIRNHERYLEICLREKMSKTLSAEMLSRQLADIDVAYSDVNILRAQLADMAANKTFLTLKNGTVPKWFVCQIKEVCAHKAYAAAVLAAASSDANKGLPNTQWKRRVECDYLVVRESEKIKNDVSKNKTLQMRKKHLLDLKRVKAILAADLEALRHCWPHNEDYSDLASFASTYTNSITSEDASV